MSPSATYTMFKDTETLPKKNSSTEGVSLLLSPSIIEIIENRVGRDTAQPVLSLSLGLGPLSPTQSYQARVWSRCELSYTY